MMPDSSPPPRPSAEAIAYARATADHRYHTTLIALGRGDHREHIATLVFDYNDAEDQPTAGDIADRILEYFAAMIADLIVPAAPLTPADRARAADLMTEATSHFIQPHYADEAILALETAGWTITPPR